MTPQVALNEQFMLASLPDTPRSDTHHAEDAKRPEDDNRVLRILMSRLGSSMAFGENMIFMLNRASKFPFIRPSGTAEQEIFRPNAGRSCHATPCPQDLVSLVHDEGDL